jgi:PAS domain S-box-containing protein
VRLAGDIVGVVVITRDVSEHHRMAEETREARALAESILSTVREPLVVLDGDQRVVSANRSFLTTFQLASEQAEGRPFGELAGGQWDTPDLRKVLTSILPKQAELSNYELVQDVPSLGKRAMLLHGRQVQRPKGAPELMLLSFQDVTDRDERIRLTERQRQLETANEELDAFAYSVSHDLRAPLRAIDGFSRIIAEDFANHLPDEAKELIARVRKSAERMQRLIEELLSFSRLAGTVPKFRPVNMRALAESVLADRLASERQRTIDVEIEDLPEAQCDPDLLRQVWDNLVANAIKYTRRRDRALVRVSGRVENQELVYTVEDNGVGFDMQYAGRLFGVFQRFHTDAQFEGVGVGLSLVRRIVARHGGRVWADATPGVGAKFSFALPK